MGTPYGTSIWTVERTNELRRLWEDGKYSASQIAELMGLPTRSVVIGKAHRLKLTRRTDKVPGKVDKVRRVRVRVRSQKTNPHKPTPAQLRVVEMKTDPVPYLQSGDSRWYCHFIEGEPGPDAMVCNQRNVPGLNCCADHRPLLWRPSEKKRRRVEPNKTWGMAG
jgi:hypothetical protein